MPARSFFRDLSASHERLRDLVMTIKVERDPARLRPLAAALDETLRQHFEVEEEVLYPTLTEAVEPWEERIILFGALEDHRLLMIVLDDLEEMSPTEERFHGLVHALDKLWSHHVEEEEDVLYDMAQRHLPHKDFAALADRMQRAQEQRGLRH